MFFSNASLTSARVSVLTLMLTAVSVQCGPTTTTAQVTDAADQIAGAVQAAPAEFQEGARVLGFDPDGNIVDLRAGSNEMVCLADDPGREGWSVACYHSSLDPFMAMGRSLRAQGTTDGVEIRRLRFEAADAGELSMPQKQASLYVMTADSFDPATGELENGYVRYVLYTPYATAESSGLPTTPDGSVQPWLMFPGTAGAHVMITPASN
ncbi:MAG: hypothetical protein ACI80V_003884 [Rhodothermales bacterium]|jgi:hypothetical protein